MTTTKDTLRDAIAIGAPIYNSGDPAGCLRTYVKAAVEVIDGTKATDSERSVLRNAVGRATEVMSKDEGAWIMRRAFDSILSGAVAAQERVAEQAARLGEFEVLSFENGLPSTPRWRILDDVIMGGRSQSEGLAFEPAERAAVFSGRVTTDGGGGFASLRSDEWAGFASLTAARGIRILVKGDGRQYKLNAKTDADWDGVQYQYDFVAPPVWGQVDLPFSAFKPTFRGRLVPNRPPLQGQQIRQLGLMVSKFTADGGVISNFRNGSFRLGVRWIKGFV
ncbi:hypothetical protein VOLCADRAFT_106809 [Volvox carteri f. nagariensis]|uniref:NADH:ubiquinone oxidoreductase intermediate-associated protein 30 domain-containing protein n=1 Tax=Volvox carteri f. nagariensis TaxID=3068 RepID=D8U9W8_VOLCA|nr:uncharacterized protein VOLCADRAFT_106809 [Volvox carteri f. nagariensis]EFJ43483.1 hypothetical protein VOLCADRAFT_106809 [Volvox carteri f. nagariensis]|eukprot:XP_002955412.1 hypothetical protein VOLCADRAFT_106809 [Volvox carteri f. nagariensis]